jgi:hypothetical protein
LNGEQIRNLHEAVIAPEPSGIFDSEGDRLLLLTSYDEFVEKLRNMWVAFLRFDTNFKKNTKNIWVNSDAAISVNCAMGKGKVFLGKWKLERWLEVKREMKEICDTQLIVKPEWYLRFRDELVMNGEMGKI